MAYGYDERILGAKQQAETARKLREGITTPEGQMVSGWYVPPSITQHLANALKQYTGYKQETAATEQAKALELEKQSKMADLIKNIPTERTAPIFQDPNQATAQQVIPASSDADMLRQMQSGNQPPQNMAFNPQEPNASMLSQALRGQTQQVPQQIGTQQITPTDADRMAWTLQAAQVDPTLATIGMGMQEKELARQQAQAQREWQAQQAQQAREANFGQQRSMAQLAASLRPAPAEKMIAVMGKDGSPIMLPQSQVSGMTPYNAQTMKGEGTIQQRVADAKESNALLNQVEQVGAIATGSGLGRIRDTSAGFFGGSTEGANAAAKLKVLGASLTAKVPKMSGPQSDKDVAMYKEAAGNIADPNIPWEQKQSAIETIKEINNRQIGYASGNAQPPAKPTSNAASSGAIRRFNPATGQLE